MDDNELREHHADPGYTGWKFFVGRKTTLLRIRYEDGYPVELASLSGRGDGSFGWWEQTLHDLEAADDLEDIDEELAGDYLKDIEYDWIKPTYDVPAPALLGPCGDVKALMSAGLRYLVPVTTTAVSAETMMGPSSGPVDVR